MSQHNNTRTFCVHFLVCQQDSTESFERISSKLEGRTRLSPEYTPLTFGVDLEKRDGSQDVFFD